MRLTIEIKFFTSVCTDWFQIIKRGATVRAMAICTRHQYLHIYKVIFEQRVDLRLYFSGNLINKYQFFTQYYSPSYYWPWKIISLLHPSPFSNRFTKPSTQWTYLRCPTSHFTKGRYWELLKAKTCLKRSLRRWNHSSQMAQLTLQA